MKLIINKKGAPDSITLDIELTATVKDLMLALYNVRGKLFEAITFDDYQKVITLYQYSLYGEQFKIEMSPEKNLSDYNITDLDSLILEESLHGKFKLVGDAVYSNNSRPFFWETKAEKAPIDADDLVMVQACQQPGN